MKKTKTRAKQTASAAQALRLPPSCSATLCSSASGYPCGYPISFVEIIEKAIQRVEKGAGSSALIMVSFDNLAMVISGYGGEVAEEVFQSVSKSLRKLLSPTDYMERIQRDQIAVMLTDTNREETLYIAKRIYSLIQHFGYDSCFGSLHLTSTISYVPVEGTGCTPQGLLNDAYVSLRSGMEVINGAPQDGFIDADLCRQEMGLANYLNSAIKENRLRLAFQPIVESKGGTVSHYEALLRVVGLDGTISSAGALIPIAERMGLIHIIDELVLKMVIDEVRRSEEIQFAFNVSNLTISDGNWLRLFKELLADSPEVAQRLIVEITETAAHRDLSVTANFVAAVQSLGAQVALDDFGSGYTSFRQLKTLSLDMVKIDGAFVRDLADNADNRFFVKTLLDFTKGFGLKTVAEFVENGEVAKMLMELDVTYMQGYYFGKAETTRPWLK